MNVPETTLVPRLSEAARLLPLISGPLDAAAQENRHCAWLRLLPIVEEGLFGYEIVPDQDSHTYLIIGRDGQGRPSLRTASYHDGGPEGLHLVAVQGRLLSRSERASRYSVQSRDEVFADWHTAVSAACAQLRMLFPEPDSKRFSVRPHTHRELEEALRIAHSHLDGFDPFIEFFGLPNEAELGFPLSGADGEHGELIFREPKTWSLRWQAGHEVVAVSWSISTIAGGGTYYDRRSLTDRRVHRRRAIDRGEAPMAWSGVERRRTSGRRAGDRKNKAEDHP